MEAKEKRRRFSREFKLEALRMVLAAVTIATTAAVALCSEAETPKKPRPPIVLHIGEIGVGILSTDALIVKVYGEGVSVDNEGHLGGRYFTNSHHSVTLHTEMGVDRCTESLEITKGLHIPGVTAATVPASAVSLALNTIPSADHGIVLGMTPKKLLKILGPPKTDEATGNRRVIYYETSYEKDDRVGLFYQAKYEFLKNRLVAISLYDGE